jgi:hypothetical protein
LTNFTKGAYKLKNKRILFILLALIFLILPLLLILRHQKDNEIKHTLLSLSSDAVLEEYFNAVNRHDRLTLKNIVEDKNNLSESFSNADQIKLIEKSVFSKDDNNICYRVLFEVKFKTKTNSIPDGKNNWLFYLTRENSSSQWKIHDFGY